MANVAVLGSGVIGSAAAYELSRAGHHVTVLSESPWGGVTSQTSFAWVNSNNKDPRAYHDLNVAGMRRHAELQAELAPAQPWYVTTGCFMEHSSATDRDAARARMSGLGYPVTTIAAADAPVLEPAFTPRESESLFFPTEGFIYVERFIPALKAAAVAAGTEFRQVRISSVDSTATGVTVTSQRVEAGGALAAAEQASFDHVFIALGKVADLVPVNGGPAAGGAILPMFHSEATSVDTHCYLGYADTGAQKFNRVYISDAVNFRPFGESGLVLQAPALEYHLDGPDPEEHFEEVRAYMEEQVNARLAGTEAAPIHVDRVILAERSLPLDGHPILGFVDEHHRVSTAVSHSGVTLSALYGRLALEFVAGREPESVTPFKLDRFDPSVVDGTSAPELFQQQGVGRQ
ncbi:NAD(P)/FAD-dependent oxidoreductase [Brevibacterium moorei]|uniref:NAD(P)/FAD-dependent oxidoreductase n=1 Tax=Brevibacterium moorei TaxID=2968457 RepID=UPI00211BFA28|nr:FAD-binding oxidoreductase [Brevibacterium sp. 68QC2CO]MCQ9386833.1 FAD-binding oxidoreductase [Brevibacterium sp. 68QC2CO]